MSHLNQLQSSWQSQGFEVLGANYANNDTEIATFISTYGVNYGLARVTDDSGYTVPIYSTCFAISRWGTVLWTGLNDQVTDTMVQNWLAAVPPTGSGNGDDEDNGCVASGQGSMSTTVGLLLAVALALRVLGLRSAPRDAGRMNRNSRVIACPETIAGNVGFRHVRAEALCKVGNLED